MFHVIIVDDEPLIREGLTKMIPWGKYEMQVDAVFPNGRLALEYLEREPVQLVITDIRMPVMDGIALMQECQTRKYPARFIVLSGYSDFEYVKTAARIGIENYLLKPVDFQEMSQTLLQVRRKIMAQKHNRVLLEEGIRILRNNLLYRLMIGEISYDEILERKDYLPIPLHGNSYRVAILKFLPKDPAHTSSAAQKPPIHSVLRHLEGMRSVHAVTDFSGRMLYLLFYDCMDRKKEIQADLEHILDYVSATSPFCAFVALGEAVPDTDRISESHQRAFILINTIGYNSPSPIRWAEESAFDEAYLLPHVETDQLIKLNEKCTYKNKDEVLQIADDIFYTNRYIPVSGLQILSFMIVSKVYSNIRACGLASDQKILSLEKELEEAWSHTDHDSLRAWVHHMIEAIFAAQEEQGRGGSANIRKILLWLNENYNKDINLKTLADLFSMNALYLGRILKLETGVSFTEYINRLRLDKASELLIHTDLSAKQISEKVGYNNDKYFNTLFRKHTGMTPLEYRRNHT